VSKPPLGVKSSQLSQSLSVGSLEPNGVSLSCDECIKTFNKVMEANDLRQILGVFNAEQTTNLTALQHVKDSKQGAPLITQGNGVLREDPPTSMPT